MSRGKIDILIFYDVIYSNFRKKNCIFLVFPSLHENVLNSVHCTAITQCIKYASLTESRIGAHFFIFKTRFFEN